MMFGGIKIIESPYLGPDFFVVKYPPKPWLLWGRYVPKQLRKYSRKLRASAYPEWLQGYMMGDTLIVHPTTYKKMMAAI